MPLSVTNILPEKFTLTGLSMKMIKPSSIEKKEAKSSSGSESWGILKDFISMVNQYNVISHYLSCLSSSNMHLTMIIRPKRKLTSNTYHQSQLFRKYWRKHKIFAKVVKKNRGTGSMQYMKYGDQLHSRTSRIRKQQ